tara:strand:+ start:76 stop:780 length:705 start_codon:yes stop_codon:yes gene_type:complete
MVENPFKKFVFLCLLPNVLILGLLWGIIPMINSRGYWFIDTTLIITFSLITPLTLFSTTYLVYGKDDRISGFKRLFFATLKTILIYIPFFAVLMPFMNSLDWDSPLQIPSMILLIASPIVLFLYLGIKNFSKDYVLPKKSNVKKVVIILYLTLVAISFPSLIEQFSNISNSNSNSSSSSSSSSKKSFSRSEVYSWYSSSYPNARIMVDSAGDNWRVTIINQSGSSKIINVPKYQ